MSIWWSLLELLYVNGAFEVVRDGVTVRLSELVPRVVYHDPLQVGGLMCYSEIRHMVTDYSRRIKH